MGRRSPFALLPALLGGQTGQQQFSPQAAPAPSIGQLFGAR